MDSINVIAIVDGVVDANYLFEGPAAAPNAEVRFIELCQERIHNFDEYTAEDLEAITDNGYEKYGSNNSICISWPTKVGK